MNSTSEPSTAPTTGVPSHPAQDGADRTPRKDANECATPETDAAIPHTIEVVVEFGLDGITATPKGQFVPAKFSRNLELQRNATRKLAEALELYNVLLGAELNELAPFAISHRWTSKRVQEGQEMRDTIAKLKREAGL